MINIRIINKEHKNDINIPNEPFRMFGKIITKYDGKNWSSELVEFPPSEIKEMCFPDENYDFDNMSDSIFIGAYDSEKCVGLAILQPGFFKYMYLYDLKVNSLYRGRHIGKMLIEKAKELAKENRYTGIYTQGQDNNPGACLFYLNSGFYIGGLDTNVYRGTKQEGKSDIIFYTDCDA